MEIFGARDDIFYRRLSFNPELYDESRVNHYGNETDIIARGVCILRTPVSVAQKMANGTVSANDFMSLLGGNAGEWWATMDEFGWDEFAAYAYGNGALEENALTYLEEDPGVEAETALILIAKRPISYDEDWSNSDNGAVKPGERIQMIEIQYNGGKGWRSVSCGGMSVTARK